MPDLLSHVFIAYSICRVLFWRWQWFQSQYITIGLVGALIPDMVKIALVIPSKRIEKLLGVPFHWASLHTGGGVALSVAIGIVLLAAADRRSGAIALVLGASSHLIADSLLLTATGHSQQLFWPLYQYRVPSPGLYHNTQPEPTIVTGVIAALVWVMHKYFIRWVISDI